MRLRDYQTRDIGRIVDALRKHRAVCYQLPTGAGKTIIAAEICRRLVANGQKGLALVHRRELVRQFVNTLVESEVLPHFGIGIIAAGQAPAPWATFQVASVQTLARREVNFDPRLIFVDEAHHIRASTWETLMQRWPTARILGLTATPARLDGKGLGAHFDVLLEGPTIPELVEQGYLAPTRVKYLPEGIDLTGVRTLAGDYNRGQLQQQVNSKVIASAANSYLRYAKGKKALFFGISVKHSQAVVDELRKNGVKAAHLDGGSPTYERDSVMKDFAEGDMMVIGNCQLFDEGVDVPACSVVMLGSPTKSVTRYLQSCGRAMRPQPGKEALILDLAGTCHYLDLPDAERHWTLEGDEAPKKESPLRRAINRTCEKCHTVYPAVYPKCPACGLEYQGGTEPDEVDVELEDATPDHQVRKRTPVPRWRLKTLIRQTGGDIVKLQQLGKELGYKPGWAHKQAVIWASRRRRPQQQARP